MHALPSCVYGTRAIVYMAFARLCTRHSCACVHGIRALVYTAFARSWVDPRRRLPLSHGPAVTERRELSGRCVPLDGVRPEGFLARVTEALLLALVFLRTVSCRVQIFRRGRTCLWKGKAAQISTRRSSAARLVEAVCYLELDAADLSQRHARSLG